MVSRTSYGTGEQVCIGDVVEIDGRKGQVVACIGDGQYSREFPEDDWSYLKTGVLWKNAELGLVHVPILSEPSIIFIRRDRPDATIRPEPEDN